MSIVDMVVLCLIMLPAIAGVFYGFLGILLSLLSWVASLGIAIKLMSYCTPLLAYYVDTPMLRNILAFIGLFILSLLIMASISYCIVKLIGKTGLSIADRMLGLFFGVSFGGLIVAVLVFMGGFTALPQEPWWEESKLTMPFEHISIWSVQFLPESITKYHTYE